MNNYLLKCENINKFYQEGEKSNASVRGAVFFLWNLQSWLRLWGSSRFRKSTLLHTLGGLDHQVVGKCLLMDNPCKKHRLMKRFCVIVI